MGLDQVGDDGQGRCGQHRVGHQGSLARAYPGDAAVPHHQPGHR